MSFKGNQNKSLIMSQQMQLEIKIRDMSQISSKTHLLITTTAADTPTLFHTLKNALSCIVTSTNEIMKKLHATPVTRKSVRSIT